MAALSSDDPTRIEIPPRRLTSAKPSSSAVSSPRNTGTRPGEGGDGVALAMVPGLKLHNHFARDQAQCIAVLAEQPDRGVADRRTGFGNGAIMQRQRPALVFEPDARLSLYQISQFRAERFEGRRGSAIGLAVAAGRPIVLDGTPLDTVQP